MAKSLDELGRLGPVNFPTLGWQVIDWIEAYLRHGPGDIQGERIELDEEFARFICHAYRIDDVTGRRLYRRAVLSRPKGRAKSELAGMLVCAELLGPVRFDGWAADGEPVGKPVRSPFIRCLATEESQTGNTYDNVRFMLDTARDEHGGDFLRCDVGLTRVLLDGGTGEIRPSTASAASKDGGKETFAVGDEIHLATTPELRGMHRTVERNLAKRKLAEPWKLDTTTAYAPGEESVAEALFDHVRSAPVAKRARILVDHRQAGAVEDWDDRDALVAALRDVYGPAAAWMDIEAILDEIASPEATRADSARYFLNRVEASEDQLVDPERWAELAAPGRPEVGELVTLGFDGSLVDDCTALVGCRVSDGWLFVVEVWDPKDYGGRVPSGLVDEVVRKAFDDFDVWRLYADPPHWQTYVDAWSAEWPQRVVEWWTHRRTAMEFALERFVSAVADGSLTHDGDPVLAQHVGNTKRRKVQGHLAAAKEHKKSSRKIDATIAAVLAVEARGDAVAGGALAPKQEFFAAGFR